MEDEDNTKRVKCKYCKKYFDYHMDGRKHFYTIKYCNEVCARLSRTEMNYKTRERQLIKMAEKNKELMELKGKIKRKCIECKSDYLVYVSQARARGSSYCSKECLVAGRKTKISKKTITAIKKDVWTIFSRFIRLRDAIKTTGSNEYVKCITCSDIKKLTEVDAGHFYSRRYNSLLFDEKNVHAQCKKCNMPPNSGEQYLYSLKIIELYGLSELEHLTLKRNELKSFSKNELVGMLYIYKSKLSVLEDEYGSPWRKSY